MLCFGAVEMLADAGDFRRVSRDWSPGVTMIAKLERCCCAVRPCWQLRNVDAARGERLQRRNGGAQWRSVVDIVCTPGDADVPPSSASGGPLDRQRERHAHHVGRRDRANGRATPAVNGVANLDPSAGVIDMLGGNDIVTISGGTIGTAADPDRHRPRRRRRHVRDERRHDHRLGVRSRRRQHLRGQRRHDPRLAVRRQPERRRHDFRVRRTFRRRGDRTGFRRPGRRQRHLQHDRRHARRRGQRRQRQRRAEDQWRHDRLLCLRQRRHRPDHRSRAAPSPATSKPKQSS